jgi:hypothetical protein
MRRECEPTNQAVEVTAYTFHFQMNNNGGRHACSVKVQAPNIQQASAFFRHNWPVIESLARGGLVGKSGEDRIIKLAIS